MSKFGKSKALEVKLILGSNLKWRSVQIRIYFLKLEQDIIYTIQNLFITQIGYTQA